MTSLTQRLPRTAGEVLAWSQEVTEDARRSALDRVPDEVRHIAGYHAGWWDADGRPCDLAGKAVRPALTLACARAAGDGTVPREAVAAAVAVELAHDFSLLHDDVMDGDRMRRHRPAAWSVFGAAQAILTGDVLLALAMDVLNGGQGARVLADAVLRLAAGQLTDLALADRDEVSLAECEKLAADKTGALLAAACELGALAGGAGPERAGLLRSFGAHLGMAFQIVDDLLDIWGDPAVTGKPVYSDLASRKKSLPIVAALTSQTAAGAELACLYRQPGALDADELRRAADLVEAAGGRAWALREAEAHSRAALDCLDRASPHPAAVPDLEALAKLITRRDR